MHRMIRTLLAALAAAGSTALVPAHGQVPEVLFSTPEERTLTVVEHRRMTVRPYEPSYVLRPAKKGTASDKTPEKALEGWLGAIVAGDGEWLARSFDEASRPAAPADDSEQRFLEDYFRDRRVELLHRIELDGRLLIELASFDRDSGEELFRALFHVREVEGGGWRLADLPSTPVFAKLVTDFDPQADRLTVELGHVMRTSRP